jgi:diacylglycerol kinase
MTKDSVHVNISVLNKQQKFFKAFVYAWKGIQYFFLYDRNGRIHLGTAIATVMAGFIFKVSGIEWIVLLLCIALVVACEMMNAAIEKLCDVMHKEFHPAIKIIKDISAGAVLFVSIISAAAGLIIFIPKIISLL